MYCKGCGKEMADDSLFCSHCGAKVDGDEVKRNSVEGSTEEKKDEVKQLAGLIIDRSILLPGTMTQRYYGGFLKSFIVYSDAVFLGGNGSFDLKNVTDALKIFVKHTNEYIEYREVDLIDELKAGIKMALKDFNNTKDGDVYLVSVSLPKFADERKVLFCIVEISGMFGGYKYHTGCFCVIPDVE